MKLVNNFEQLTSELQHILMFVTGKAFARRDKLVIHMNKLRHRPGVAPLSTPTAPNSSQQQQQQQQAQQQQQPPRQDTIHKPKEEPLSWNCELCGRTFTAREEWSQHARLVRFRIQHNDTDIFM